MKPKVARVDAPATAADPKAGHPNETAPWQPIATAPKGRKLIVGYHNALGKWRTVMARYYLPETLELSEDMYVENDDDGFAPEGWYEECENAETINFTERPPTRWMPLPAPPIPVSPPSSRTPDGDGPLPRTGEIE